MSRDKIVNSMVVLNRTTRAKKKKNFSPSAPYHKASYFPSTIPINIEKPFGKYENIRNNRPIQPTSLPSIPTKLIGNSFYPAPVTNHQPFDV